MTAYRIGLMLTFTVCSMAAGRAQEPDHPLRRPVILSYNYPWGSDENPNEAWTDPWFMDFERVRLSTANMVDHIPVERFREHWRTPDRRILARTRAGGEETTAEELIVEWDEALGAEGIDGMACDELIGEHATRERIEVWIAALEEIRRRHADAVLAFWTDSGVGRVSMFGDAHKPLLTALRDYADFVMPEIYYRESVVPDFAGLDDPFPAFREKVEEWEAAAPGITPKILMGLGTVQNAEWAYDDVEDVDYGEFLARQVEVCATDPVLKQMAGLALYAPGYLRPETLTRVNDAIIKHYELDRAEVEQAPEPATGGVLDAAGDAGAVVVDVRDFGATGDGVTEDGAAIERAVDYLNALPESVRPTFLFPPGCYLITGSSNFSEVGTTEGVKAITHDNVTVLAWGAELRVPDDYHWERTTVGGDERDHFARGLQADGRNFTLHGGLLNGNLENREVLRGPAVAGYGGGEMGLRINAPGARVFGTVSRGWGTDCCYVAEQAELFDCSFQRGRRLGVAVVVRDADIPAEAPIRFVNCRLVDNSRYPDDICNNPGAGIDIENEGGTAAVHLLNCLFAGNRTYAIYLSSGARDTLIQGCSIRGSINLQPSNLGGHRIIGNSFGSGSYLYAVYGNATDAPSAVIGNTFEDTPAVTFRDSADYPNGWTIARNVFLGAEVTGVGRLLGEGHVVRDNTFVGANAP